MNSLNSKYLKLGGMLGMVLTLISCTAMQENAGHMAKYGAPSEEIEWIRNGDPIEFEGDLWYPQDAIDILLDSEVYLAGEYRDVQLFTEKTDVRPYDRLYTKFGRNKFRIFRKAISND